MVTNKRPLWITTKEVRAIVQCSGRKARRLLERTRKKLKKSREQPVSFAEFGWYMGIDPELLYRQLGW
jgi:hypothetical protein